MAWWPWGRGGRGSARVRPACGAAPACAQQKSEQKLLGGGMRGRDRLRRLRRRCGHDRAMRWRAVCRHSGTKTTRGVGVVSVVGLGGSK
eukprot:312097-Prymnesium_polylepis.1